VTGAVPARAHADGGQAAAAAETISTMDEGSKHVQVRLVSSVAAVAPGQGATVAVVLDIEPGWHTYWHGQNDSGLPTSIEWVVPEGVKVTGVTAPVPKRYVSEGDILDYVHEGRAVFTAEMQVPADAKPGTSIALVARVKYLVCKDGCLPGAAEVSMSFDVVDAATLAGPAAPRAREADVRLITQARAAQARRDGWGKVLSPSWAFMRGRADEGLTLTLRSTQEGTLAIAFAPDERGLTLRNGLSGGQASGGELKLVFDWPKGAPSGSDRGAGARGAGNGGAGADAAPESVGRVARGIVTVVLADGQAPSYWLEFPAPAPELLEPKAATPVPATGPGSVEIPAAAPAKPGGGP
jgi:hypothetical protein